MRRYYMGDCYSEDDYWVDFLLKEVHFFFVKICFDFLFRKDLYFLFRKDL